MELQNVDPEPQPERNAEHNVERNVELSSGNGSGSSSVRHIAWTQLRRLGATVYPTLSPFGRPTTFVGGKKFLIVGTFGAEVLLFGYDQTLLGQLSPGSGSMGAVTSLALSQDESHVVVGYGLGAVCLFDLEAPPVSAPRLLTLVKPMTDKVAKFSRESHIRGLPIVGCGFVGRYRRTFVSVDAAGVVVVHRYHRVLLEHTTRSSRVLGSYDRAAPILSTAILGKYVALLTQNLLLVVLLDVDGTNPVATEVLAVARSSDTDEPPNGHGIVKLRQKVTSPALKSEQAMQLVYTWGRQLKLVDLTSSGARVSRAYTHPSPIEQLDWMVDLVVLLSKHEISFINRDAAVVDTDTLVAQPIKLAAIGTTLFALGKYEFSVGQLANWADRLLWLVNSGEPARAIRLALQFYSEEGDLSVFGLPTALVSRQATVRQALPNFVLTAIKFSVHYDEETLKTLLPEAIRAAVVMRIDLFEQILDLVSEEWPRELFLRSLIPFVLNHQLTSLPPTVFKELVRLESDPQLFYTLDISTLDLDFAFKLCSKHSDTLGDVRVYLQNQALRDYTSALNDKERVFRYLALTLSSRVYPTEQEIEEEERAQDAKLQIYGALFLDHTDHALLRELLSFDEPAFYSALNEAFEDPWLNENADISRQTLIGQLLHLEKRSDSSSPMPRYQLCLFIAQNYAKYRQFLVLPDAILLHVVKELCSKGSGEEPQLALLSLLSSYKPHDAAEFVDSLVHARFTLVLEHVLRQRRRLLYLVELKLQLQDHRHLWDLLDESFHVDRQEAALFVIHNVSELVNVDSKQLSRLTVRNAVEEVWGVVPQMGDQALSFLDEAFAEIDRRGGKLPPMDTRVAYLDSIMAQENDAQEDDGQQEPNEKKSRNEPQGSTVEVRDKLLYILEHVLSGTDDVDLRLVVDSLIAHDRIDALALLLCRKNRRSEAMIYVLNHIPDIPGQAVPKYVDIACNICIDVSKEDKQEAQQLWQRLLETLVVGKHHAQLRKTISVMADSNTADLAGVATYLLNTTSYEPAPQLVGELYADMAGHERALRCFYEIALNDGYQELLKVIEARASGWMVPVDGECETCGHKIVGLGISAAGVYKAWFSRISEEDPKNVSSGREADHEMDEEALILFQCGHSYHLGCLERMTSARRCVVCDI